MYLNVPPTLMRALAGAPDTAKTWSERNGHPSHPNPPAVVAKNGQAIARRQVEARADAILSALGPEAVITRIHSLTCSTLR